MSMVARVFEICAGILRVASKILLALGVLALVIVAAVAWRLYSGPLSVDFLTPRLEAAFAESVEGDRLDVGDTVLVWDRSSLNLDLRTRDVRIIDPDGVARLSLDAADIAVSSRGLLRGVVAVKRVEVAGARFRLVRGPDGEISLAGFGQAAGESAEGAAEPTPEDSGEPSGAPVIAALTEDLMAAEDWSRPLTVLRELTFEDSEVVFQDQGSDAVVRLPIRRISLRRHADGLAAELDLSIATGTHTARLHADLVYRRGADDVFVDATFEDVLPVALADALPDLADLSGIDVALDGSIVGRVTLDGAVDRLSLDLTARPGTLALPDLFPEPLHVAALSAKAQYAGAEDEGVLESLQVALGTEAAPGPKVAVSAQGKGLGGNGRLSASVQMTDLAMARVAAYWPPKAAKGGRAWVVDNISAGTVERASLDLDLRIPKGGLGEATVTKLAGSIGYRDLEVRFLKPLPPAKGVSGTASFDDKAMRFEVKPGGTVADIAMTGAKLAITDFDKPREMMDMTFGIRGPAGTVLSMLGHPEIDLLSGFDADPGAVSGELGATGAFTFPLLAELSIDDISIKVDGASDRLVLASKAPAIADLKVDLHHDRLGWRKIDVRGKTVSPPDPKAKNPRPAAATADFTARFAPTGSGPYALAVRADDTGALLRALDITDGVREGQLEITGLTRGPKPGDPLDAQLDLKDYILLETSMMARVLTAASITGLQRLIAEEGLRIDRLHGPLVYEGDVLSSEQLRLKAASLAATTGGKLWLDREELELAGMVVPADNVSGVFRKIPVIKGLFSEDGGFVAIDYKVTGPVSKPKVSVQKLKSLTPHLLQRVFGDGDDKEDGGS